MALSSAQINSLLTRARSGDEAALTALLSRLRPTIYRWAAIMTGDSDEAEDIAQQVSLTLQRKLATFEQRSSITTWVYRIVRNTAIESLRRARHKRELRVSSEDGPPGISDDVEQQLARIDNHRAAVLVRSFFAELPARQRELIELVDVHACTVVEAAEIMGVEPVTARVHLMRARRALRSRMLELHPELAE